MRKYILERAVIIQLETIVTLSTFRNSGDQVIKVNNCSSLLEYFETWSDTL